MDHLHSPRHKIFFSYQREEDRIFRDFFAYMIEADEVGKSVEDSDIRAHKTEPETLRQKIRDDLIADAEVTVVLLNPCTWQSRRVDWEIGASLTDTPNHVRCGLVGIILPHHPDFKSSVVHTYRIPPRLADNSEGTFDHTYGQSYSWPYNQKTADEIRQLMRDPQKAEQERQAMLQSRFRKVEWAHQLSVTHQVIRWIDEAYQRSKRIQPDNSREQFLFDKSGHCFEGWRHLWL